MKENDPGNFNIVNMDEKKPDLDVKTWSQSSMSPDEDNKDYIDEQEIISLDDESSELFN